jgi:hypothetical protein
MIAMRSGTRVWLAAGVTDMRCGIDSLAVKVQTVLAEDPYAGHVFAFRGRRGDLVKLLWSDGDGMCLLTKRGAAKTRGNQQGLQMRGWVSTNNPGARDALHRRSSNRRR